MFFNAEDGAGYALAVNVLDATHLAGVNTIGMMTDPPMIAAEGAPAEGTAPAPAR
jgi:biopolymer transport protein TolR